MNELKVRVECYAGYRGEESPRRFYLGACMIQVMQELHRWIEPNHRCFKVKGSDDGMYILRHDVGADRWEVTLLEGFDRGG